MGLPGGRSMETTYASSRFSRDAVERAAGALLQWLQGRDSKPQLLEQDEFIYLQLSLHRFPSAPSKSAHLIPRLLPVPHPLFADQTSSVAPTSICIFFDDRSSSASPESFLDRARSLSLPVEAAIGLSSLRTDYQPYEARRRLCDSYDLFFADRNIIPLLPRLIGKEFFRKKKAPLPLNLTRTGWPLQLRHCLNSAFFHLPCKGTSAVAKVGRASMTAEEIADNVMAAVDAAVEHVPKGWENVRSLHVKVAKSVALPVYQAVPQMSLKIATKEDYRHDGQHESGEVVDNDEERDKHISSQNDKERDKHVSSQKKQKRKKKGRIHEEIARYMQVDETIEGARNVEHVSGDENEEGNADEVEQIAAEKMRKKKEGKIKKKQKGEEKKRKNRTNGENFDVQDNYEDFGGDKNDELSADTESKNKKMKKKAANAGKKLKEGSDDEQVSKADRTSNKIKKMKKAK